MSEDIWTPLDPKTGSREAPKALVEGVPPWLIEPLWDWVYRFVLGGDDGVARKDGELAFLALSLTFRLQLGSASDWYKTRLKAFRHAVDQDADFLLSVSDWALHSGHAGADLLKIILSLGGSAWTLAPDSKGLARRVMPEAQAAAEMVIAAGGKPSDLIGAAWHAIYGRSPNVTDGFNQAVRAVEAVVCPVILPNDGAATLGRALGHLRANRAKFTTVFQNARDSDPMDAVIGLMALVWTNNYARHAADPKVPLHVSQEEAEAALHAAVTLVQWFQRGVVSRVPPP